MTDLYVKGPGTIKLVSDLAINSFTNFGRNKAKQIVRCNPGGYVIGDCIVFGLEDDKVSIVGRPALPNWVQFNAQRGNYRVTVTRDERTVSNPSCARLFVLSCRAPMRCRCCTS
jgi:vanillate/3-O-methylgallate O-demethylase